MTFNDLMEAEMLNCPVRVQRYLYAVDELIVLFDTEWDRGRCEKAWRDSAWADIPVAEIFPDCGAIVIELETEYD